MKVIKLYVHICFSLSNMIKDAFVVSGVWFLIYIISMSVICSKSD